MRLLDFRRAFPVRRDPYVGQTTWRPRYEARTPRAPGTKRGATDEDLIHRLLSDWWTSSGSETKIFGSFMRKSP
jgi:hypothetical protein